MQAKAQDVAVKINKSQCLMFIYEGNIVPF